MLLIATHKGDEHAGCGKAVLGLRNILALTVSSCRSQGWEGEGERSVSVKKKYSQCSRAQAPCLLLYQ